uniref:CCR4-NOT transcription complex subunit 9 n=1 Tax=Rhabditophanes sp. KR3021 TaxID=114890 RepID=A0AC35UBB6_9BILA
MDLSNLSHSSTPSHSISENLNSETGISTSSLSIDPDLDSKVKQWILDMADGSKKEEALNNLSIFSAKREELPDLAVWLWNSFGTMSCLLAEILTIYPHIHAANLPPTLSNPVCNALALMQCVASHKETRLSFLNSHIPLFLYPFLHINKNTRSFEYIRLTSLGVIGALVRSEEKEVITFLLNTEIVPLCLRIMENGTDLSKTVSSFILQKILVDDNGLNYICQTYERFNHVAKILQMTIASVQKNKGSQSPRLLKQVVRCYSRLSYNPKAVHGLLEVLPPELKDDTFKEEMEADPQTKDAFKKLMDNLNKAKTRI